MTSRERVLHAINHQNPDRVPIDIGGSLVSGIMAGALVRLRKHLGMDDQPVKVYDCFQMLGHVATDLVERLQLDLLPVEPDSITFRHIRNRDYKPWTLFDGTEVLVPGSFNVEVSPQGDWLIHEDGDPNKPVLGRMPKDGFYFDITSNTDWHPDYQPPSIESLRTSGWGRLKPAELDYLQGKARVLRQTTDKALVLTNWGDALLGPPMVGSLPDWLTLLAAEPAYIADLFALSTEVAIDNLKLYWQAIGEDIDIINIDGFDFGTQNSEMISPKLFERFFEPSYKAQCDWIHQNTPWKVAKHCCGSIVHLIEPMIRAGIDVLNPVQISAAGMEPAKLKQTFGDRLTFWGGGVDTQRMLPFGTPEQVYSHVCGQLETFMPGGGFIWAAVHNIQYDVPAENIMAALQAVYDQGWYG